MSNFKFLSEHVKLLITIPPPLSITIEPVPIVLISCIKALKSTGSLLMASNFMKELLPFNIKSKLYKSYDIPDPLSVISMKESDILFYFFQVGIRPLIR